MMKQAFVTLVALLLASAGRPACAQMSYEIDYYRPAENRPVDIRIVPLPSLDVGPSLQLQEGMPAATEPPSEARLTEASLQSDDDSLLDAVEIMEPRKQAPPVKIWEGGCELGLNGSEGNSGTFNFHFGLDAKRKTDASIFDSDLNYNKNTADSRETANRMFLDSRYEWIHGDSPWTSFAHNTTEYDELKAYNVRVTLDGGVGYKFIDNDATSLTGRFGSGVSHEIGGPDKQVVPELTWGMEFEHQLTKRQKLKASTEFVPDVTDFADFRLNTKLGWEVLLDEDWNLSLKLGILDRYDSTPNGSKPNDFDYSTTLLWSF